MKLEACIYRVYKKNWTNLKSLSGFVKREIINFKTRGGCVFYNQLLKMACARNFEA